MSGTSTGGKQTALVTGASGGIGLELAKVFAREGYNLILVARRADKMNELAAALSGQYGTQSKIIAKDLSDPAAPDELFNELQTAGIRIDVLVNNAGFAAHGLFATETNWKNEMDMLQVNIVALTHLTKLFVKPMVERRSGKILNVGSTGSFVPGPLMAVYDASKAYVLSFSEALAVELQGTGVSVTALCPGATASGFQDRANVGDIRIVRQGMMSAAEVSEQGYRALLTRKPVVVTGLTNQFAVLLPRFLPRQMVARMAKSFQTKTG